MLFITLKGNSVNVPLNNYRINWRKPSASKFQTRVKNFFEEYYSHLRWFEEVPLKGIGVERMRWDFLCVFQDKFGKDQKVFVEVQGNHHVKLNPKFQKSMEEFDDQLMRDILKRDFAEINSKFELIEFFETDKITLSWFLQTYPNILPFINS